MSAGLSPAVLVWTRAVELFANRLVASAMILVGAGMRALGCLGLRRCSGHRQ